MSSARPLRALFLANDGFSAGHVVRALAVMRALGRRAGARGIGVQCILATTSEAHGLLEDACVVRLPAPDAARHAGFSDAERRRIVRGALAGTCEALGPDVVVVDTFPFGPHGELSGLDLRRAKRVLVRRAVPNERHEVLEQGLDACHLAIVADDPISMPSALPVKTVRVPPITCGAEGDLRSREDARAALGLPRSGRVYLVTAGGGGDSEGGQMARRIADTCARLEPDATVAWAVGPLARRSPPMPPDAAWLPLHAAPLWPYLRAFDGAFAAAGYNTAHELVRAGLKAALFGLPRPYDDQAARARRFADESLAHALSGDSEEGIAAALGWMNDAATVPSASGATLGANGADHAADAVLDLVTGVG